MRTILCLGGPLHGHRVTPDRWPPSPVAIAAVPRPRPIGGAVDINAPTVAELPQEVRYELRLRSGVVGDELVYVAPDYRPRPFTPPLVGRALAVVFADHGLREGEHYIVNREEP